MKPFLELALISSLLGSCIGLIATVVYSMTTSGYALTTIVMGTNTIIGMVSCSAPFILFGAYRKLKMK